MRNIFKELFLIFMEFKNNIVSAIIGGGTVVIILIIILLIRHNQNYDYREINVLNIETLNNSALKDSEYFQNLFDKARIDHLKVLKEQGVILTPQEYTNNIVSYYNTIIVVLISFFAILSIATLFQIKSQAKEYVLAEVPRLLKDKEFTKENIWNNIEGDIDNKIEPIKLQISEIKTDVMDLDVLVSSLAEENEEYHLKLNSELIIENNNN